MIICVLNRICSARTCKFVIQRYCASNVLKLNERGLLQDVFPPPSLTLQKLLSQPQCFYAGFDPTADSLHIGNLLVLMTMLHCQRAGHQTIALIGGATALIGDPSGKSSERIALPEENVKENTNVIGENITRIFQNHEKYIWEKNRGPLKPVKLVNNADWYNNVSITKFLSTAGRHFRVGAMLSRNSVQSRINSESGISFTEFSYQVLQGYDWLHLLQKYKCRFQIGGSDQMGNIVSGHELISRMGLEEVFGLTIPLVTNEAGSKLGKTAGNAVWITPSKTSPYELYQFFMRVKDSEVEQLLKLFTFCSTDEISTIMEKQTNKPESRVAHRKLAQQVTLLVHGENGLKSAERITEALYSKSADSLARLHPSELNETFRGATMVDILLEPATSVLDMVMKANCFANENDARRIILAGGLHINQVKCTDYTEILSLGRHILPNGISLIRVGKKHYYIIKWMS
ncbi:tyrosine--tRNA ligase, mitochondrial-like [Daphnia pulicaria]|uniref:tyrosine--tRNA ligase, mitochondrial-like n=1 Tax=Daphnia pulicaria TaxID=35523 RepID=UPI001EEB1A59|nr:tyrosine--tRNA ligase, mitochondrial-like [Daphnia pulicaria]